MKTPAIFSFILFVLFIGLSGCRKVACDGQVVCASRAPVQDCGVAGYPPAPYCRTEFQCVKYGCCPKGQTCYDADRGRWWSPSSEQSVAQAKLRDLTIDRAMVMAAEGDLPAAQAYGLTFDDISTLLSGGELSKARIEEIARLQADTAAMVTSKLNEIRAAFQEQRTRVDSTYWQACMRSGKWVTDANTRCESTSWNGCTPDSGAQFCISRAGADRIGL